MHSLLYAVNSATQAVSVDGTIDFGRIVRRYGREIDLSGGSVALNGAGYYAIDAAIAFEGTAAGVVTITLYKDGVAIPGASALRSTADGTTYDVAIPCIVREKCCCESVITAVVTGAAIDVTNATIRVIKL